MKQSRSRPRPDTFRELLAEERQQLSGRVPEIWASKMPLRKGVRFLDGAGSVGLRCYPALREDSAQAAVKAS